MLPQILVDAAAGYGLPPSQSFYFLLWASRRLYCHNNSNNNNSNNNNNNKDHQAVLHTSFVPGDLGWQILTNVPLGKIRKAINENNLHDLSILYNAHYCLTPPLYFTHTRFYVKNITLTTLQRISIWKWRTNIEFATSTTFYIFDCLFVQSLTFLQVQSIRWLIRFDVKLLKPHEL